MRKNIDLKNYIEKVYLLEKFLFEQETLERRLRSELKSFSKDKEVVDTLNNGGYTNYQNGRPYKRIKSQNYKYKFSYGFESDNFLILFGLSFIIFFVVLFMSVVLSDDIELRLIFSDRFWGAFFSSFLFALKIGVFTFLGLSIIYIIVNIIKYFTKNSSIRENNKIIENENYIIQQDNNKAFSERMVLRNNIQKEHKFIYYNIIKTKEILNKIYSMDIVYPKYRNLCAISSFYEYLKSGRCACLEGHEGAYNIFENEIRLDRIVLQLDQVIKKLDEIKRNQFMLYEAVKNSQELSNEIIREIKGVKVELNNVQNQNSRIIDNTRITAYNSRITAQNTDFLKWYTMFS